MKYFQHDTNALSNRKLRKVIRTHGAVGYGIWWSVLESLYKAETEGFLINADELWLEDLAEQLHISDHRTLIRVLDTFAEVGLISSQLWADHVLYCDSIAERGDAYIQKRIKEREKKQKQRAKKRVSVPKGQSRDKQGTGGQKGNVPPTDPDSYSNPDSNPYSDSDSLPQDQEKEQKKDIEKPKLKTGEQANQEKEEGVNQEEGFKAEEADQNFPVPCQRSTETVARTEDVHETNSLAAPQKTQPEEKPYFDPTGDRFNAGASLPIWRAKRGPNGWNEEFLEIFIEQNKKDFEGQGWTRRKAIAFIVNNESPGSPKHETLMGYVDEVQKELDRRNARISQPSTPTTRYQAMTPEQEEERRQVIASQRTSAPPEVRRQFDEIRARARQKQEQEAARRDRWAHLPQQA